MGSAAGVSGEIGGRHFPEATVLDVTKISC